MNHLWVWTAWSSIIWCENARGTLLSWHTSAISIRERKMTRATGNSYCPNTSKYRLEQINTHKNKLTQNSREVTKMSNIYWVIANKTQRLNVIHSSILSSLKFTISFDRTSLSFAGMAARLFSLCHVPMVLFFFWRLCTLDLYR